MKRLINWIFNKKASSREELFAKQMRKLGFKQQNEHCWHRRKGFWCDKVFLYFRFNDCVEVSMYHPNTTVYVKNVEELKAEIKNKFGL